MEIKKIGKFFDLDELSEKYSMTKDDLIEKINEFIDEELEFEPDIDDERLADLVKRSLRLHLKAHTVSKAVPVIAYVIGKTMPFDYIEKRRKELKILWDIDPRKAINEGIGDAKCDPDGNIIYNHAFKKGPYPEHGYRYEVFLLAKILTNGTKYEDTDFKILVLQAFDESLDDYEKIKEDHWYSTKLQVRDYNPEEYVFEAATSSVTEWKEIKEKEEIDLVDVSYDKKNKRYKQEGLIFSEIFGKNLIQLSDINVYYNNFKEGNFLPPTRFVVFVADIVTVAQEGNLMTVIDDSLDPDDPPIICWDNRPDKSFTFGPRSKVLIFGHLRANKNTDSQIDVNCFSTKRIPREKGGYYYPSEFETIEKILRPEKKEDKEKEQEKQEDQEEQKEEEEEKIEEIVEEDIELFFDKRLVDQEVQNEIVTAIYTLEGSGSYDDILQQTGLKNTKRYQSSFKDLLDRKIIIKDNGGIFKI